MIAPPGPLIEMTVVCDRSGWRILVRGELDLSSGQELLHVVTTLAAARMPVVTLDLAGVTFIDTAGWDAVLAARQAIEAAGGVAAMAPVSATVTRFATLAGGAERLGSRHGRHPCRRFAGTRNPA
jgi:anti-anti-sigma factor